jgi:hypothetical protein
MITLVTGEVSSGKKTWISKQIIKQICKEQNISFSQFISDYTKTSYQYWENICFRVEIDSKLKYTEKEKDVSPLQICLNERTLSHLTNSVYMKFQHLFENYKIDLINKIVSLSDKYDFYINTQDYINYYALRVAIKEGKIPLDQVKFIFMKDRKPIEVKIDKDGRQITDVEGFFDVLWDKLMIELA